VSRVYDLLARVYDQFEHFEITQSFERAVWPTLRARVRHGPVLDIACGTGVLAERLARRGATVVGVDGSREMLRVARKRCRGLAVELRRDDLLRFRLARPAATAVASAEVFNHFLDRRTLVRALRNVRRNLAPGGVLVFDATNRFGFSHYWPDRDYLLEGEGGDVAMCCSWDPARERATARMVGYARIGGPRSRRHERFELTLELRHWRNAELRLALREAGFGRIVRQPWSPWPDQHEEPALDRNLWWGWAPGARAQRFRASGIR